MQISMGKLSDNVLGAYNELTQSSDTPLYVLAQFPEFENICHARGFTAEQLSEVSSTAYFVFSRQCRILFNALTVWSDE